MHTTTVLVLLFLLGDALQKSTRLRRFKSDRDEIWQNCSSNIYASTDGVGFDTTSYFQRGGHDVRPPLVAAYALMQQLPPAAR